MFQIPREEILFCPTTSSISSLHKLTLAKDQIGKFRLGVKNEPGQRLIELCQENMLVIANILFQQYKRQRYTGTSPDDQYQNQIDYVLCTEDREALHCQQKQYLQLTVAWTMSFLLKNSSLN